MHTALLGVLGMDQVPVVDPAQPARGEAARKSHFHLVAFLVRSRGRLDTALGGIKGAIERVAIETRDRGDIFRLLEPPLDLERTDPEFDEFWNELESGEIARRQQVASPSQIDILSVAEKVVGHPAGLGAFPPVGGSSPERLRRQALSGIRDAQGAVDERLERDWIGVGGENVADLGDLGERILPCEHHEGAAKLPREPDARGRSDGHLRASMDREVRRDAADHLTDSDILHDRGVHPRGDDRPQRVLRERKFVLEYKRIEGDIPPHAAPVEPGHQIGKVGTREVVGAHARVERVDAEIDGVGAVFHGGLRALPVARRSEDLGTRSIQHEALLERAREDLNSRVDEINATSEAPPSNRRHRVRPHFPRRESAIPPGMPC